MATKRIMLLGADGQIGQALQAENLPADWQFGAYGHSTCDITDHRLVQNTIHTFKPDLVINAAAMTAVDKCEVEKDRAVAVNFEGAANLAAQCAGLDIPLIHLSTDFVFDGQDGNKPYIPDDKMNPVNVYGQTKMMGEEAIRHEHAWHVIVRVSSVFSRFSANLMTRTLQMIDECEIINAVTDQKSCPTHAVDIAQTLVTISNAILRGKSEGFGIFHFCGMPAATRLEFVQAVMRAYARYTDRRPAINPALSSDFPNLAARPPYSVMNCSKIKAIYGIEQKSWQTGLLEAMTGIIKARK